MTPTEGQTTTPSGARHLTDEQVLTLNERHGWFQYRDAQSDVSRQFAHDAIEMYLQAKRDAVTVSPNAAASVDVLGVLTRHVNDLHEGIRYGESINDMDEVVAAVAALIARNAELEAQTPSALREKLRSCRRRRPDRPQCGAGSTDTERAPGEAAQLRGSPAGGRS